MFHGLKHNYIQLIVNRLRQEAVATTVPRLRCRIQMLHWKNKHGAHCEGCSCSILREMRRKETLRKWLWPFFSVCTDASNKSKQKNLPTAVRFFNVNGGGIMDALTDFREQLDETFRAIPEMLTNTLTLWVSLWSMQSHMVQIMHRPIMGNTAPFFKSYKTSRDCWKRTAIVMC